MIVTVQNTSRAPLYYRTRLNFRAQRVCRRSTHENSRWANKTKQ